MTPKTTCPSPWIATIFSLVTCLLPWTPAAAGDPQADTEARAPAEARAPENLERYAGRFEIAEGRSLLLEFQDGTLRATAAGKAPWSLPTWPRMSSLDVLATPVRISRGFLNTVSRGQAKAAHVLLAEQVRNETDPAEITAAWQSFKQQWGEYRAIAPFALEKADDIDKVSWLVEFERRLIHVEVAVEPGMGVVSWSENSQVPQRTVELRPAADGTFFVDASRWQLPDPHVRIELDSRGEAIGAEIRGDG